MQLKNALYSNTVNRDGQEQIYGGDDVILLPIRDEVLIHVIGMGGVKNCLPPHVVPLVGETERLVHLVCRQL